MDTFFHDKYLDNQPSEGSVEEIEVDEMASYIGKKRQNLDLESCDHNTQALIGLKCSDHGSKTLIKFFDEQNLWQAGRVYADFYAAYQEVVWASRLRQGKRNTYKVEQNNALQRYWPGRFRRRTQIVSLSIDMVNRSLGLFQRFRVNGSIDELLSLIRLTSLAFDTFTFLMTTF